ncbi:TetR/AcrR family transcriptional regulator [Kitasatospora purpeofusca]|uniref:TetR/AcrR family transcriptional regulator n=1 Tax=Kitasatospora purpeofusca TaxID=67352 RepID=UPI002256BB4D|nr:TetR/AcrR family transcriptional regulator [Kitasatospora purpeofusca]MCX4754235.1 TetR/AcrR family transcriptional regulator [Kitasatospora purpeofusca]WSR33671.1 TetR/AcrR family transcriptional regulator [Kitasatospora purpeofusca]WSR41773.1 TetR/AcrR family transcriptional regulator [Kitasatospora purpeofusca]
MRQERARQTRRALLHAAATEFDLHGYEGTSLARISRTAGVTLGALTFHFPSKAALADAVRTEGAALTGAAVPEAGVGGLIELLTRLLDEEPSVRAAARLSWEQPESAGNWHAVWEPELRDRLARERSAGPAGLAPVLDEVDLETLAHCLVAGSAALRRGIVPLGGAGPAAPEEVRRRLRRLWQHAAAGSPDQPSAPNT